MYSIIYFSPTGNAKYLAEKLKDNFNKKDTKIVPLEFTDPKLLGNNEHLIILYSIHGFNPPRTVKRFVKNIPSGLYEKVSLIAVGCTTGWVDQGVSIDLRKILEKKDYSVIIDEILAMPLTFIMSFPDEVISKMIIESENRLKKIGSDILKTIKTKRKIKLKSRVIHFIGKTEGFAARIFGLELYANKKCISCGTCWENCPEKNIKRKKNGRPKFGFKCLMCMRCIYNCPTKAISPRISKFILIKKGYSIKRYIK